MCACICVYAAFGYCTAPLRGEGGGGEAEAMTAFTLCDYDSCTVLIHACV
jgi:hypothetical protein